MGGKGSSVVFAFIKQVKGFGVMLVPYVLSGPGHRFVGNGFCWFLCVRAEGLFQQILW